MLSAVPVMLAVAELAGLPQPGGPRPALSFGVRTEAGPSDALAGTKGQLYRMQPEVVLALRPLDHVEVFAGAGVAPVYLVRSGGRTAGPSGSTVLGIRVPLRRGWAFAVVGRAEGVLGGGGAVSLNLQVSGL